MISVLSSEQSAAYLQSHQDRPQANKLKKTLSNSITSFIDLVSFCSHVYASSTYHGAFLSITMDIDVNFDH